MKVTYSCFLLAGLAIQLAGCCLMVNERTYVPSQEAINHFAPTHAASDTVVYQVLYQDSTYMLNGVISSESDTKNTNSGPFGDCSDTETWSNHGGGSDYRDSVAFSYRTYVAGTSYEQRTPAVNADVEFSLQFSAVFANDTAYSGPNYSINDIFNSASDYVRYDTAFTAGPHTWKDVAICQGDTSNTTRITVYARNKGYVYGRYLIPPDSTQVSHFLQIIRLP